MLFTSKEERQQIQNKKLDYYLLRLSEVERSNSGDVSLVTYNEIDNLFSMLLDPFKCYNSIVLLNKIVQRQRFSVIRKHYDNIFTMISNANNISEALHQRAPNQPILPPSEIINQCLILVDRIASFPSFYLIVDEIRFKHIKFLYNLLPNEYAFKTLGKLLVLNIEFAKYIINLGVENIASKINESNMPLFIWFLGSFGYFPDLNFHMFQFYEEYIIKNSVSPNEINRKFCYDALAIFVNSSFEMRKWISSHPIFPSIFALAPTSQLCAKKYLELADSFLTNEITSFLQNEESATTLLSLLNACFKENLGLAMIASKVLINLVNLGFSSLLLNNRIEYSLFSFTSGFASFKEKEAAMKSICVLFMAADRQTQIRFLSIGLIDVISLILEMDESEIRSLSICVLQVLIQISYDDDSFELLKTKIQYFIDLLKQEEYEKIVFPDQ